MTKNYFLLLVTLTICYPESRSAEMGSFRVLPGSITSAEVVVFWDKPSGTNLNYELLCNGKIAGTTLKGHYKITELDAGKEYTVILRSEREAEKLHGSLTFRTLPKGEVFNVRDYGASPSKKGGENARAIQAAIDACSPYGEVVVPAGEYATGALFILKNDIVMRLEKGAILRASHNLDDFPIVRTRYEGQAKESYASVLNVGKMGDVRYNNIRICGEGIIDGQGSVLASQQTEARDRMARAHGLPIINCDNVCIDGITVQNPCTWTVHPIYCRGVTTNGVTILSDGMGLSNADGWTPDSSRDCYLINSVLETHDDHVAIKSGVNAEGREVGIPAENIYVSGCLFKHGGGLAIGSEMSGGVRNVRFTDCIVENSDRGFHVKSCPGRGGMVEDILFRGITVERTGSWGISIDMWYHVQTHITDSRKQEEISTFRNITFEDIHIKKSRGNPIQIIGLAENPITGVTFRNVRIDESEYKILLRNCREITFENVQFGERYWIEDNASNIRIDAGTSRKKTFDYPYTLVDPNATYATKAMFANLKKTSDSNRFLFGAQDATSSGYGWRDDSGRSDIQEITGMPPALYSWDYMDFTRPNTDNTQDENKIRRLTTRAFFEGGVNSYCWHFRNPVTDSSFYDTSVRVVEKLIPGGSHHEQYKWELERIARYNKTLIGKFGEQVPVIFRPFHEFDGDWFWWGAAHCTPEEYKELYRFTVHYLRDTLGVRNFLYAFSPDCRFRTLEKYLERYPGDEYVDIVGMDNYWDYRFDRNALDEAHLKLRIISTYAREHGKVAALTETGQSTLENPNWFTECLMKSLYGFPNKIQLGYIAVWRNSVRSFYTPHKGHPGEADFIKFCNDHHVMMGTRQEMREFYEIVD